MKHDFHVVIERDEEGWLVGSVPALPGCHTQARSLDQLMERMQEAIEAINRMPPKASITG